MTALLLFGLPIIIIAILLIAQHSVFQRIGGLFWK